MAFTITQLNLHCRVIDRPNRDFVLGPILRGMIGARLKTTSCIFKDLACETCHDTDQCAYYQVFEPKKETGPSKFPGMTSGPSGMLLKIFRDLWKVRRKIEGHFILKVNLLGPAIKYYRELISAIRAVGESGVLNSFKFTIEGIDSDLNQHLSTENYWTGSGLPPEITVDGLAGDIGSQALIHFETPVRLIQNGVVQSEITPAMLLNFISRRIQVINHFYGDDVPLYNYSELAPFFAQASLKHIHMRLVETHRHSSRQNRDIDLDGYWGDITLDHVTPVVGQLLQLGALLQVGKSTNMGFGYFYVRFN